MTPAFSQTPDSVYIAHIRVPMGTLTLQLFNSTPVHRDNFVRLASEGYFDGTTFHRVIPDFMIQGGDPLSRDSTQRLQHGTGGPDYTLPAEIKLENFHTRGALAAARTGDSQNPERRSSGSQFYIVDGRPVAEESLQQQEQALQQQQMQALATEYLLQPAQSWAKAALQNPDSLSRLEMENPEAFVAYKARLDSLSAEFQTYLAGQVLFQYPPSARKAYTEEGGAPHLDGFYTVFGRVVAGWEVIDQVASVARDNRDNPLEAIPMEVQVERLSAQQLYDRYGTDSK